MSTTVETIHDFLLALGHGRPGDLTEFRFRPDDPNAGVQPRFVDLSDWDRSRLVLEELLDLNERNPSALMFGINPRSRRGRADADVAAVSALVLDLDGKGLDLDTQIAGVESVIDRDPPVAVVRSGSNRHGHCYWRISPAADPGRTRLAVKRLRGHLQMDATEPPSRVMRLPGSWNWKSRMEPSLVKLAYLQPTASVTIEGFEAALDAAEIPALPDDPYRGRARQRTSGSGCVQIEMLQERLDYLSGLLPEWAKALILGGFLPGGRYASRSEADMAVVGALVDAGALDDEIAFIFQRKPTGIGAKSCERGPDYLNDRA